MLGDHNGFMIPHDAQVLQLLDNLKRPRSGGHGHLDAIPYHDFIPFGTNVGIVLDATFLAIDIDRECAESRVLEERLAEYLTWCQETPHGKHWLFRFTHGSSTGNTKLRNKNGAPFGDLKTLGYIVAPGSIVPCDGHTHKGVSCGRSQYRMIHAVDPAPWPRDGFAMLREIGVLGQHEAWEHGEESLRGKSHTGIPDELLQAAWAVSEREGIPNGEHNDFLFKMAAWLRGQHGLSEDAVYTVLTEGALGALEGVDERRPFTEPDLRAITRSAARYEPKTAYTGTYTPGNWVNGDDISLVGEVEQWWVPGFIPKGELVMLYAQGGVGKSSFASWLGVQVTRMGGTMAVYGVEEPFRRFLRRSVLGGAVRNRLMAAEEVSSIRFPRDAGKIRAAIDMARPSIVYFDSIAAHLDTTQGLNIAERTRISLSPLAEIAQTTGTTILCVFHENKLGEAGGSTEMLNVARHVLHASRAPGETLRIKVKKTNFEDPDHMLQFKGTRAPIIEPTTGETQQTLTEAGLEQAYITYAERIENIPLTGNTDDEAIVIVSATTKKRGRPKKDAG
jgi:hypothetical protein